MRESNNRQKHRHEQKVPHRLHPPPSFAAHDKHQHDLFRVDRPTAIAIYDETPGQHFDEVVSKI